MPDRSSAAALHVEDRTNNFFSLFQSVVSYITNDISKTQIHQLLFMPFNKLIRPLTFKFKNASELWKKAEATNAKGNQLEANQIYEHLVSRKRHGIDDYSYAAFAESKLGQTQKAIEILEDGILKFPGAEVLIGHYSDLCVESGNPDRVIKFLAPAISKKDKIVEKFLTNLSVSPAIRKTLIDHLISNGFAESAQAGIMVFQESSINSPLLWEFGDLMLKHSRPDDAKIVYQALSSRKIDKPEEYLYSALADYRLGNTGSSLNKFETGLEKFPDCEYLFENYLRVSAESEQIGRVVQHKEKTVGSLQKTCEWLFDRDSSDALVRISLIDYGFSNNLIEFYEKRLKFIRQNYSDALILWRLGDVLLKHKMDCGAEEIYKELSTRNLVTLDDFYYAGLSEQRLENYDRAFEVLENGMGKYPISKPLFPLYIQLCISRLDYDRYSKFVQEFGSGRTDTVSTILDFYKLTIRDGAPVSFMINFKDIELRCGVEDFKALKNEFLYCLGRRKLPFAEAQSILFFSKYLDTGVEFTENLYNVLQNSLDVSNNSSKEKNYLLGLLYNLTIPMVTHYPIKPELLAERFIAGSQSLLQSPVELSEPIKNMTDQWTPWQYIFCLATPNIYKDAMAAFEQVAFKTWPKLDYKAPHICEQSRKSRNAGGKIRIGFTVHDSMPMMSGLMSRLDKNVFETVFLRPGKAGTSKVAQSWVTGADKTVEYSNTNTYLAIDTIAQEELDIIISGPSIAAIFFPLMARLAPLQMVLLEPNWTDGCINTDYYISWEPAEPETPRDFYKTAVSFLQHPPYWIEKPEVINAPALSEKEKLDIRHRLLKRGPESRIYLCANTPPKIHPKMDEFFLGLFEKDPAATLVLLRGEYPPAKSLKARLKEKLGSHYENVVFLPTLSKDDAHQLLMSVDCCLDSYPLCGMSSSFDGAMLGVPIVTLPADIPFGRWTAAIYDYIGVSGLVAKDREDYIDIAIKLASDKTWRNQKSVEIKEKSGRYVESEASFNEFQDFIIQSWKRKLSEKPPVDYIRGHWQ